MIYAIVGPTGVGKTKLSIMLAKKINAEIINCDSMQIYKEMNIGTAKITEVEKEGIVHHLVGYKSILDNYSVYDYQNDARQILNKLISQKKNVVIVGGTGLYLKALLYDYHFKEETKYDYSKISNEELISRITTYDQNPIIDLHNRRRLERYLNKLENNCFSDDSKNAKLYDCQIIGLTKDRAELYADINDRVDLMINNGLVDEAKELYDKNIKTRSVMTAIGYKELYLYFDKIISLDEAIERIKLLSRRYAKRQFTFFKHQFEHDIVWYNIDQLSLNDILNKIIK